jgi:hypothetical protein
MTAAPSAPRASPSARRRSRRRTTGGGRWNGLPASARAVPRHAPGPRAALLYELVRMRRPNIEWPPLTLTCTMYRLVCGDASRNSSRN